MQPKQELLTVKMPPRIVEFLMMSLERVEIKGENAAMALLTSKTILRGVLKEHIEAQPKAKPEPKKEDKK